MARRVVLLAFLILSALSTGAQQETTRRLLPENQKISYAWTIEPWTRDSKPFSEIRKQLEAHPIKEAKRLLPAAERAAKAKPKDAMAQFHWAFLAWRVADQLGDREAIRKALAAPRLALAAAGSPRSSEYARLRFLIEAWAFTQDDHALALLAERIYEKGYRDYPFRYWRLMVLASDAMDDLLRLNRVHAEAKRFADEFPKAFRARWMVGNIYSYKFPLTRNVEDAYAAIRTSEQVLRMLPEGHGLAEDIQFVINAELRRLKNWGYPPPPTSNR